MPIPAFPRRHPSLRIIAAVAAQLILGQPAVAAPPAPPLTVAVQNPDAVWNAVAVEGARVFLAGPRWTGTKLPPLVMVEGGGAPRPFPDAAWNAWVPGADPAHAFVNINAIHRDDAGGLWVVDTGAPDFGGDPLPGGAKLVRIDLNRGRVDRVIPLGADVARPGSYVDDIRFHGSHAYLTDAGQPGLIVLDLATGVARRVLDRHPSTVAPADRPIVVDGETVLAPDGRPLAVHSDPLEVSPDGEWLYYAPLEGPWSRVPTRLLDDPAVPAATLADAVRPWIDLPPVGGTAMGPDGSLYYTDLAANAVRRRAPDGSVTSVAHDARLHWVDAPYLAADGTLWLPAAQMDRVALFHHGKSQVRAPMTIFTVRTR
ncbi:major royal jelly protein [Nitrospirillum amazonense]|uniref:Major royal jelly protein n=1 Tax=Nitrospirillum amazonense TaxID=28077 RepID=A0A560KIC6_9PROT|nr:L-dopachrome tautomerase-related protein [Nitrospirillum amazonense]TWB83031.1 major royal jelly protein [Nitrospirillum amazonense]